MTRARDLRLGETWTPLQGVKNHALWALAWAALAATRALPATVLRSMGRALGLAAHAAAGGARRTALDNVRRALPDLDDREARDLVRRTFVSLGATLGETVAMLAARSPPLEPLPIDDESRAALDAARAQGRGVIFASAHLGPWERVAASLVAAGYPLVAVARESYDPRFTRLVERLRARHGVRVVWRGAAGAAARIVRTLHEGDVLGIPMDLRSRGVPSCDAPLLGRLARTAVGPARIALRSGAAVVVGTAAPGPGDSLRITAARIPTGDLRPDDSGAGQLTARINDELSARIRALPHAWVWMHDRWTEA